MSASRRLLALSRARGLATAASVGDTPRAAVEYCVSHVRCGAKSKWFALLFAVLRLSHSAPHRQYDYEGYLCTLALPPAARAAGFAVRAYNIETAKVLDSAKEKPLQLMRLRWWRDALADTLPGAGQEAEAGDSGGASSRRKTAVNPAVAGHPVLRALTAATASLASQDAAAVRACLERLTLAREADAGLEDLPPSTEALLVYAQAAGGSVLEALMHCTPGALDDSVALDGARAVGTAVCLAALLAGTRHHLAAGRIYLPVDIVADASLQLDSLRTQGSSDAARKAFSAVAQTAQRYLTDGRALRDRLTPPAAKVLLPATPAGLYLDALAGEGYNALADRLARRGGVVSPTSLQVRLAWAAWRGTY
jgi:NADH dehydrogenase [ubiquinone] 1 alpha subcomplex assembly factor 6